MRNSIIIGALALALGAPGTALAQDLRSPDAREAGTPPRTETYSDLRSPDARDTQTRPSETSGDLRSPDARDAATSPTSSEAAVLPAEPAPGLAWDAVGIGAAGMLGLVLAAGGIALLTFHARRRDGAAIEH